MIFTIVIVRGLDYFLVVNSAVPEIKRRNCFKCGYEGDIAETRCPKCGKPLKTVKQIRILGGILVFLGAFLILFVGAISVFVWSLVNKASTDGHKSFTGTRSDLVLIFGAFAFIILFGVVGLIAGLWQLIFGRRNKILVWVILGLGFIFVIGGILISVFLNR